ncbi:MAG TPA: LapA family protein [Bellilinea sp.]|nr:LapA family protein [Bellilinea sp.]
MITVFLVLGLIIAVVAVIFALQNTAAVTVSFFIWQFDQSLALVLLLAVALGVLIAVLTLLPTVIREKWQLSGRRKKIDALGKNLEEARVKLAEKDQKIKDLETALQTAQTQAQLPPATAETTPPALPGE